MKGYGKGKQCGMSMGRRFGAGMSDTPEGSAGNTRRDSLCENRQRANRGFCYGSRFGSSGHFDLTDQTDSDFLKKRLETLDKERVLVENRLMEINKSEMTEKPGSTAI